MAVVSSNQVAVKPFRIDAGISIADIAGAIGNAVYVPLNGAPSGWGSVGDDDEVLGQSPTIDFSVAAPQVGVPQMRSKEALAARYYWWAKPSRMAKLASSGGLRGATTLAAADIVFFPQHDGTITGLVTAREHIQFRTVIQSLRALIESLDMSVGVVTETLSEVIPDDLFLWLLYRLQWDQQLTHNVFLGGVQEISSLDRQVRGAKFLDEASVDRIELASLIAVSTRGWGPAKINLMTVNPDASLALELHADGGFQPFRRSSYNARPLEGASQAIALIEDLWVTILPELRAAYLADKDWFANGRLRLRVAAHDRVLILLGSRPSSNNP